MVGGGLLNRVCVPVCLTVDGRRSPFLCARPKAVQLEEPLSMRSMVGYPICVASPIISALYCFSATQVLCELTKLACLFTWSNLKTEGGKQKSCQTGIGDGPYTRGRTHKLVVLRKQ